MDITKKIITALLMSGYTIDTKGKISDALYDGGGEKRFDLYDKECFKGVIMILDNEFEIFIDDNTFSLLDKKESDLENMTRIIKGLISKEVIKHHNNSKKINSSQLTPPKEECLLFG
jgi:hypothetical protein